MTTMTLALLQPMARPDNEKIDALYLEITRLYAAGKKLDSALNRRIVDLYKSLLEQIINLPSAPPMPINVEIESIRQDADDRYIAVTHRLGDKNRAPRLKAKRYRIEVDQLHATLASMAMDYRQEQCRQALIDAVKSAKDGGQDVSCYGEIGQVFDPYTFEVRHPAGLLTDYQRVDLSFERTFRPGLARGTPRYDWTDKEADQSWIAINLDFPDTIIESLPGKRLAEIIKLDNDILAPLPRHAVESWHSVVLGDIRNKNLNRVQVNLEPARQISWIPGMLPATYKPNNAIETAIVNLALSGELI